MIFAVSYVWNIAIFLFFNMAAAAILDFWNFKFLTVGRSKGLKYVTTPNFVEIGQNAAEILRFIDFSRWWPRYVSFNIMLVWLENAYSRPFWGVFGAHFPQMMSLIVLSPKRTILGQNQVIWAINRENRSHGSSWACVREKKDRTGQEKKSQKGYISPICGEAPPLKRCTWKFV